MNKITFAKKHFFIVLTIFFTTSAFTQTFDASKLTNNLSQTESLADTYFTSYKKFIDSLCYSDYTHFIFENKMSLNAVWYTGFDINTDFGTQKGSLAKGYADYILGFKAKHLMLSLGTGGSRYGVFLSDISFNIPKNDPCTNIKVTDFTGAQIMNDIYAGVLGINKVFWLGGYFFTSSVYSPTQSGLLDSYANTSVSYYGAKLNIANVLDGDAMINSDGGFSHINVNFNPYRLLMLCFGNPIDLDFTLLTGINWNTEYDSMYDIKSLFHFNWRSFKLPASFDLTFDKKYIYANFIGGARIGIPNINLPGTINLSDAYFGLSTKLKFYSSNRNGVEYQSDYGIVLKGSFISDKSLFGFGRTRETALYGIQAGILTGVKALGAKQSFEAELSWRYNYLDDLKNLPEVKDKHVFVLNIYGYF